MKVKHRILYFRAVTKYGPGIPKDMLRYDSAFQALDDPTLVAFPTFTVPGEGTFGGEATHARWASFGIRLEPLSGEAEYQAREIRPDRLVTYVHPMVNQHGKVDYDRLEPVTLAAYIQAKNFRTVRALAGGFDRRCA
jgi:hypothetical protein